MREAFWERGKKVSFSFILSFSCRRRWIKKREEVKERVPDLQLMRSLSYLAFVVRPFRHVGVVAACKKGDWWVCITGARDEKERERESR